MDCKDFMECIDNLDNLDEITRLEMNRHAKDCKSCSDELDFVLSVRETMRSLPKIEPPADFMDKLNIRLDMEERRKRNIVRRAVRNINYNRSRYAAVAACFALVAVLVSNGTSLVNTMNGTDDGVISDNTVITDNTNNTDNTNASIPTFAPIAAVDSDSADNVADTAEKIDEKAVETENTVSAAVQSKPVSKPTAKAAPASTAAIPVRNTQSPAVAANTEKHVYTPVTESPAEEENNFTVEAREPSEEEISASNVSEPIDDLSDDNVAAGYSLANPGSDIAHSRYYSGAKSREAMPRDTKPIGKIKISAEDAEEAINLILHYSYCVEGNFYSTDSANLSLMLSDLNGMGVSYTNYTPAYEGEITFQLVIS